MLHNKINTSTTTRRDAVVYKSFLSNSFTTSPISARISWGFFDNVNVVYGWTILPMQYSHSDLLTSWVFLAPMALYRSLSLMSLIRTTSRMSPLYNTRLNLISVTNYSNLEHSEYGVLGQLKCRLLDNYSSPFLLFTNLLKTHQYVMGVGTSARRRVVSSDYFNIIKTLTQLQSRSNQQRWFLRKNSLLSALSKSNKLIKFQIYTPLNSKRVGLGTNDAGSILPLVYTVSSPLTISPTCDFLPFYTTSVYVGISGDSSIGLNNLLSDTPKSSFKLRTQHRRSVLRTNWSSETIISTMGDIKTRTTHLSTLVNKFNRKVDVLISSNFTSVFYYIRKLIRKSLNFAARPWPELKPLLLIRKSLNNMAKQFRGLSRAFNNSAHVRSLALFKVSLRYIIFANTKKRKHKFFKNLHIFLSHYRRLRSLNSQSTRVNRLKFFSHLFADYENLYIRALQTSSTDSLLLRTNSSLNSVATTRKRVFFSKKKRLNRKFMRVLRFRFYKRLSRFAHVCRLQRRVNLIKVLDASNLSSTNSSSGFSTNYCKIHTSKIQSTYDLGFYSINSDHSSQVSTGYCVELYKHYLPTLANINLTNPPLVLVGQNRTVKKAKPTHKYNHLLPLRTHSLNRITPRRPLFKNFPSQTSVGSKLTTYSILTFLNSKLSRRGDTTTSRRVKPRRQLHNLWRFYTSRGLRATISASYTPQSTGLETYTAGSLSTLSSYNQHKSNQGAVDDLYSHLTKIWTDAQSRLKKSRFNLFLQAVSNQSFPQTKSTFINSVNTNRFPLLFSDVQTPVIGFIKDLSLKSPGDVFTFNDFSNSLLLVKYSLLNNTNQRTSFLQRSFSVKWLFYKQHQLTSINTAAGIQSGAYSNLDFVFRTGFSIRRHLLKHSYSTMSLFNFTYFYSKLLVEFAEYTTGKRFGLNVNPSIENGLSSLDLAKLSLWESRVLGFRKLLGPKIFVVEALYLICLAMRIKDPMFLGNWLRGMLKRLNFWKHKLIFRYLKFLLRYIFYPYFSQLGILGVKFQLKGKISVAGNARTRTIFYKIGETSHSKLNHRVGYDVSFVTTFTGAMGLRLWFFY